MHERILIARTSHVNDLNHPSIAQLISPLFLRNVSWLQSCLTSQIVPSHLKAATHDLWPSPNAPSFPKMTLG